MKINGPCFVFPAMVVLPILAMGAAWAQAGEWTNVGPNGGAVRLTIDPQNPATFYAGTGTGLFKSTDRGASWNIAGLIGWDVSRLLIDPHNTSTLYAQAAYAPDDDTDISKVFKSTDGGATWNDLVSGATMLAIDPQDTSTLYALAGGNPPGLFKSTDGGASWARLPGLPANFYTAGFAIDPQNHNTLYVPVQGASAGRPAAAVFKSMDGGASWHEADSGLPDAGNGLTGFPQGAIAIDPKNPSTVYVTRAGVGVYKSTDGGANWRAANSGLPNLVGDYEFMSCCGSGVAIDPQNPSTLYAPGQNPTNPVIYKSTNGGSSWRAVSSGLWPGLLGNGANPLTVDPQDTNTVYVSTGIGLFRSTDGGTTFDRYSWPRATPISALAIDPLISGTLYAGGFKSTDAGMSWVAADSGIPQGSEIVALAIDPQTPGTVYTATDFYECGNGYVVGIFKSVDGGMNWTDTRSGAGCGLTAVVVDPQSPATIYAGSSYRGVYKSTDGGASWNPMNSGLPSGFLGPTVNAVAIDPENSGTLYASSSGGLYKSTDGGASWSQTGLTSAAIALAIDPQNTSMLYAVTSSGLFKTADGGATWQSLSTPSSTIYAVAVDPQTSSTIYAGTDMGVAQSTDGGESWMTIPGGPQNVRLLALDPQDPGTVYAGGPGGLFAISLVPQSLSAEPARQ